MADKVVAVSAEFDADPSNFVAGIAKALAELEKLKKQGETAFNSFDRAVRNFTSNLSGANVAQKLQVIETGVARLGGVAKLNADQVAILRKELDALGVSASKIPKSLQLPALPAAAKQSALAGALDKEGLAALQGQASSLGPLGSVLAAIGPAGLAAGAAIAVVGGAMGAAAATAAELVKGLTDTAARLTDLSQKTALSTTFLQEIGHAGNLVGVSLDDIGSAATKLSAKIGEGDDIFQKLGLSLEKLQESSADEQFTAVADAIARIPEPATQAAAAIQAFGKGGAQLLPLIRSDMAGAREEAERLGIVLGSDLVKSGDALDDTLSTVNEQLKALRDVIGGELVKGGGLNDTIRGLGEGLAGLIKLLPDTIGFLKEFVNLVPGLNQVATLAGAALGKVQEVGRFGGVHAPSEDELDKIRNAPQIDLNTALGLDADFQNKLKEKLKDLAEAQRIAAEAARKHKEELRKQKEEADRLAKTMEEIFSKTATLGNLKDLFAFPIKQAGSPLEAVNKAIEKAQEKQKAGEEALKAGQADLAKGAGEWAQQLENVANIVQGMGGAFGKVLSTLLTGIAGIGASLAKIKQNLGTLDLGNLFKSKDKGGISLTQLFKGDSGKFDIGKTLGNIGAIGSIVGAGVGIGKAILGLFKGDPVKKAQKEIAKELGHGISKEFAEQALEMSKSLGISLQAAAKQLEKQGLFDKLADLKGKAKEGAGSIVSGLSGFGKIQGAADAQGRIFGKQFWAVVAVEGFAAAIDSFKATFASLPDLLKAAVPADLQNLFKFADNEQFKGAVDGIAGLAEGFKGLVSTIGLTKETLADYGTTAQAAFDQAKAGALAEGATDAEAQKAALEAIVPLLAAEADAAKAAGIELDANTQALLDQAKAAGINIPTDPLLQVVDVLKEIEETLKAIGGLDVNPKVHVTTTTTGTPPPTGGPPGAPPFARGGIAKFPLSGGLAILHGREAIIPLDRPNDAAAVVQKIQQLPGASVIPSFASGGITDTGGFGATIGGGTTITITMPVSILVDVEALGDNEAIGDQVARALDAEVPVLQDAVLRTIRQATAA